MTNIDQQPAVTLQGTTSGRIAWTQAGESYWINVRLDGDRVGQITTGVGRDYPTLFKLRPAAPGEDSRRRPVSYLNATGDKWAETVRGMISRADHGLIAQARAEAIEAHRVREAESITASKADAVRRLMAHRHGMRRPGGQ